MVTPKAYSSHGDPHFTPSTSSSHTHLCPLDRGVLIWDPESPAHQSWGFSSLMGQAIRLGMVWREGREKTGPSLCPWTAHVPSHLDLIKAQWIDCRSLPPALLDSHTGQSAGRAWMGRSLKLMHCGVSGPERAEGHAVEATKSNLPLQTLFLKGVGISAFSFQSPQLDNLSIWKPSKRSCVDYCVLKRFILRLLNYIIII